MELRPWNPWNELERARRDADRLIEAALARLRRGEAEREVAFVPAADLIETPDEYRLYVSVPGVLEEDIDITARGDALVIRGERETPFSRSGATFRLSQWKYGYFEHRIPLPDAVDVDSIRATLENGVLQITIPKSPAADGESAGE